MNGAVSDAIRSLRSKLCGPSSELPSVFDGFRTPRSIIQGVMAEALNEALKQYVGRPVHTLDLEELKRVAIAAAVNAATKHRIFVDNVDVEISCMDGSTLKVDLMLRKE